MLPYTEKPSIRIEDNAVKVLNSFEEKVSYQSKNPNETAPSPILEVIESKQQPFGYLHFSDQSLKWKEDDPVENFGIKWKSSLSDVSEESNYSSLLLPPKKRRMNETPDRTSSGPIFARDPKQLGSSELHESPANWNNNITVGGYSAQGNIQHNSFEMFLGQNQGISPTFYPPHFFSSAYGEGPHVTQNDTPNLTTGQKTISGMTPLVFSSLPKNRFPYATNTMALRNVLNAEGQVHRILHVVSSDSQADDTREEAIIVNGMMLSDGISSVTVPLQKPKKWIRWSEQEDQHLRRAVATLGENNFKMISERVFHGTRTEVQCKNRWKKALQPGLIKGRWTKDEDDIITEYVQSGNTKWADIAKLLPGRIGEQIKERWVNCLDPEVKKGVWSQTEMNVLMNAQKELGNRWSEIAKLIPGRSENSVKNRWYNQKTSDRRAEKKAKEIRTCNNAASTTSVARDDSSYEHDDEDAGEYSQSNIPSAFASNAAYDDFKNYKTSKETDLIFANVRANV